MVVRLNHSGLRVGLVARQIVLFVIFGIALASGVFEFAYSRPAFQAAWEKIEDVDSSSDSSEYTARKFEELIGKKPFAIDETQPGIEVRTYRWPSALPMRSHDIHVVYTKLTGVIAEKNPELAKERFYYSASGGTRLTIDNFPAERTTLVYNRNPPQMAGGPPPSTPASVTGSSEDNPERPDSRRRDKKEDGEKQEDKKGDPEKSDETNKTAPDDVEKTAVPDKTEKSGESAEEKTKEAPPKGGEAGEEQPGETEETPKPDSGEKGGTEGEGSGEGSGG